MIFRQAVPADAAALYTLNREFNGEGVADIAHIEQSLRTGGEIVCIAEEKGVPAGFCCAQVVRSFCYPRPVAEITELYVREDFRLRKAATALMRLAEMLCAEQGVDETRLLTGGDNLPARALYESLGYEADGEVHYQKNIQA